MEPSRGRRTRTRNMKNSDQSSVQPRPQTRGMDPSMEFRPPPNARQPAMVSTGLPTSLPAPLSPQLIGNVPAAKADPTDCQKTTPSAVSCSVPVEKLSSMRISQCSGAYPDRPGAGSAGQQIQLDTNHFLLQFQSDMVVYHYSISVSLRGRRGVVELTSKAQGLTSVECRLLCTWAYKSLFEQSPHKQIFNQRFLCAYDGRTNMYTLNALDFGRSGEYIADLVTSSNQELTVVVKPCDVFQLNMADIMRAVTVQAGSYDRSALQALDVITSVPVVLRNMFANFGNCFYKAEDKHVYIGNGFELYSGFFKSLRLVQGLGRNPYSIVVNVESKKAPFYAEGPLLDSIMDELGLRQVPKEPMNDRMILCLRRRFKGVKVRATHTTHCFKIADFLPKTAMTHGFSESTERPEMVTVYEYFQKRYNIKLRYPCLPLVLKGRCAFPVEVLHILPGQRVSLKQLTENSQREIIKNSAVAPFVRRADIMQKCKEIGLQSTDRFAQGFGVSMKPEMMRLTGRVLNNPTVQYDTGGQNRGAVMVNCGAWEMRNQKVFVSAKINRWAVINMSDIDKNRMAEFMRRLTNKAAQMGVQMQSNCAKYVELRQNQLTELSTQFETLVRVDNVTFVICIMPEFREDTRNQVKFAGEVRHGLITQCLRKKTVLKGLGDRGTDTLFLQIMLKVNAKNGGVNNEVRPDNPIAAKWIRKGVMFVGFDVNHPPALSKAEIEMNMVPTEPSVVGAVANSGRTLFDYRMCYRLQDARQEVMNRDVIVDVMRKFLNEYKANNKNQLPDSVIVYRDGVADTQFPIVVDNELRYLIESLSRYKEGYSPKLTLLVVQKRHHTRFFKTNINPNEKCAQQNIPAGTVVDSGPVSAVLFDFYLCSHVGIQGTSKPAQYTVLYDENGFDADSIQALSYLLCQTYQKCNRSVSLPAPVYHAHHAATRGKELVIAVSNTRGAGARFGQPTQSLDLEKLESMINMHDKVSNQMVWA